MSLQHHTRTNLYVHDGTNTHKETDLTFICLHDVQAFDRPAVITDSLGVASLAFLFPGRTAILPSGVRDIAAL